MLSASPSPQRPLSVSELTSQIKDLLEAAFPEVWVAGEISNFARPQSGHCYLTLKDDRAQLRAVMWRGVAARLRFEPQDGMEVVCRGHVDLYAARGSYQLVIADIVPQPIVCGKIFWWLCHFCHSERSEESRFSGSVGEILRCAQNA